jgi:hypothetical protein
MTTPKKWLTQFLRQRDLQQPDGRMLYAYRLEEHEYASLRDLVGTWLSDHVLRTAGQLAAGVAELFVLYGAAWWQREYAGGAWRWDDVISSFGSDPDWWSPQFRSQCVQVGLQYWKQQIPTSGKRYFGVLVEQGGLPRVLLAQSKGNIYALIRAVLKRAARLGAEVDEIAVMAADYQDKLPRSLQNETVHLLIAQIIGAVLDLKREFKLNKGDNAVARLDNLAPRWRERFPVALDDQAAIALLGDLVGEAAAIEAETRAAPVVAERLLVEESGVYALVSRVEFPKQLLAETLAGLVGIEENDVPFRFAIDLHLDKRYLAADVRKALGTGLARHQFTVLRSKWRGELAMREHLLCIALPGRELASVPVPGGMEMDSGSPWVFVSNGEECRLVAQGSVRLRQDQAYVVVDDTCQIVADGPDSLVERLGKFASESLNRTVFKLHGAAVVSDGTHLFRIRTGQAGAEAERPVWEGRRFPFASSPNLAFYGVPKLCRYTAEGERAVIPAHELEWRVAGTTHVVAAAAARGTVDVLWRVDGELRLRSRMVILDRQSLRFQSGESVTQGHINIPAAWAVDAVSTEDPALRLHCERHANWLSVDLGATEQPPESVRLTLDWKSSPVPCRVTVPFPASGGRFVDRNETRLDADAAITRDQLLGIRLRVFDSNPDHPVKHKLVFTLRHIGLERLAATVPPIEHILDLQDNRAEVRLIDHQNDINSLLSQTDALDAVVTVALVTGSKHAAALQVKRYEFALVPDGAGVAVSPSDLARLPAEALSGIDLFAIKVESMHCDQGIKLAQQSSEGVPTGRWDLPSNALDHQWIVYPAPDSSYGFRAVLVDAGRVQLPAPTEYTPAPESIEEVLQIGDPERRRAILARRLDALADDFAHPDWRIVDGVWSNLGHLTLPTLDLWRAFAMNPAALAGFACRYWESSSLEQVMSMCSRFHSELGVLWETIPLSTWYAACAKLSAQYHALMPTVDPAARDALIIDRIGATLRGIRLHFPALHTLLAFVAFQQTGQEAETVAPLMRARLQDLKTRLWLGEDSALQTIMLRNSADRRPPLLSLYNDLPAHLDITPAMAQTVYGMLWDPSNPKAGVANMPVLLALCTCNGFLHGWWSDPKRLIQLRQYRDFDRDWFSHAFDQAVAMFIASGAVSTSPTTPN